MAASVTEVADIVFGPGELWSWGRGVYGRLGDGTTVNKSSPVQVGSATNWMHIPQHGFATTGGVNEDGKLYMFGYNIKGALGIGTTTNMSSPSQVGSLTNWASVSSGFKMANAVKTDNTLWGWGGQDSHGCVGNNSGTDISSPVQIGSLTDWSVISANMRSTLAVKTDGTLWAWGKNQYGMLGDGSTTSRSSPVQIGSLTNWSKISCGSYASAAVKTDGTLWTWGGGNQGRLGRGNTTNYSSPVQLGSATDWKDVDVGSVGMAAVKTGGALWMWGTNDQGQLGRGDTTNDNSSPIQVGSLTNWSKVGIGNLFVCGLKKDGTLWGWGKNNNGYLGTGNTTSYSSPVQIGSLTTWIGVYVHNKGVHGKKTAS